jgi:hypothetical protein
MSQANVTHNPAMSEINNQNPVPATTREVERKAVTNRCEARYACA